MAWELTGNSGTNPASDFLGTTDERPLVIKTHKEDRIRISEYGNVFISSLYSDGITFSQPDGAPLNALPVSARIWTKGQTLHLTSGVMSLAALRIGPPVLGPISHDPIIGRAEFAGRITIGSLAGEPQAQLHIASFGVFEDGPPYPQLMITQHGSNDLARLRFESFAGGPNERKPNPLWDIAAGNSGLGAWVQAAGSAWSNVMTLTNSAKVGIGTMNPPEKLTVAGVIASTSGGFKFPDGSVQTTATLHGQPGPPGPPGPSVKSVAICGSFAGGNCVYACPGGHVIAQLKGPCIVTSETGSCSNSIAAEMQICCVCKPS